jgi:hypothetical protein
MCFPQEWDFMIMWPLWISRHFTQAKSLPTTFAFPHKSRNVSWNPRICPWTRHLAGLNLFKVVYMKV